MRYSKPPPLAVVVDFTGWRGVPKETEMQVLHLDSAQRCEPDQKQGGLRDGRG
ncbi:MAG: hypothetical protein OEW09_13690 [Anaerolineae bacterium]|nr:hypothetical protein [Anaerolineae bacterium]